MADVKPEEESPKRTPEKPPELNLDEAVKHLAKLVDLSSAQSNVQNAILAALTGSAMYAKEPTTATKLTPTESPWEEYEAARRRRGDEADSAPPVSPPLPPPPLPPPDEPKRTSEESPVGGYLAQLLDVAKAQKTVQDGILAALVGGGSRSGGIPLRGEDVFDPPFTPKDLKEKEEDRASVPFERGMLPPDEFPESGELPKASDSFSDKPLLDLTRMMVTIQSAILDILRTGGHGGHKDSEEERETKKKKEDEEPLTAYGRFTRAAGMALSLPKKLMPRGAKAAQDIVSAPRRALSFLTGGSKTKLGRALGSGGLGGGSAAGSISGAVGKLGSGVGAVVGVGMAFKAAHDAIADWTTAALESAHKLVEFSGSMAAVFAEKEMMDILREQKRGERTAGSTHELMRSEAERKDATLGIDVAWTNIKNSAGTMLNKAITPVLEGLSDLLETADETLAAVSKIAGTATKFDPGPLGADMRGLKDHELEFNDKARKMMEDAKKLTGFEGGVAEPGHPVRI